MTREKTSETWGAAGRGSNADARTDAHTVTCDICHANTRRVLALLFASVAISQAQGVDMDECMINVDEGSGEESFKQQPNPALPIFSWCRNTTCIRAELRAMYGERFLPLSGREQRKIDCGDQSGANEFERECRANELGYMPSQKVIAVEELDCSNHKPSTLLRRAREAIAVSSPLVFRGCASVRYIHACI